MNYRGTKVLTHCHLGIWGTAPGYLGKIKNEVIDRDKGKDPEGWIIGTAGIGHRVRYFTLW